MNWTLTGAALRESIATLLGGLDQQHLRVVWCAGRAGFAADEQTVAHEVSVFRQWVASFAEWSRRSRASLEWFMVSSAGGLFEGCRFVEKGTQPHPLRPYGAGKLEMERILAGECPSARIYRPTSIYGRFTARGRNGLIATMVENTKKGSVTRIFGSPNTLRDYVHVVDIAEFMVGEVLSVSPPSGATILGSGRSISIFEVKNKIERALKRAALVSYDTSPSNMNDMSFARSAIAPQFSACDFETSMRRDLRTIL